MILLDKKAFIGTLAISYGMFNDIHFLGGSLYPNVTAHSEYRNSIDVLKHDREHQSLWYSYLSQIKSCGLYALAMHSFMDIADAVLKEEDSKTFRALGDFLFIVMHEDSPIHEFQKVFKDKHPVTKQDIFNQFLTYNLPGGNMPAMFSALGLLVAKHGYPNAGNTKTFYQGINQYRADMMKLLKERGVY